MARSFKHTYCCPVSFTEHVAPPSSPLISPERDAGEIELRDLSDTSKPADSLSTGQALTRLSLKECAAVDAALGLPSMIPTKRDNLCALPTRKTEAIKPGTRGISEAASLSGSEMVYRRAHKLSRPVPQRRQMRRIGVETPWVPDALTSDSVLEAHIRCAQKWWENGTRNPLALPETKNDGPPPIREETDDEDERPLPGTRAVWWQDVNRPYPVGPFAGEEFTMVGMKVDCKPPRTLPARPVGVFDPAEVLYYAHRQRQKHMRQLVQLGWSWKEAMATAEAVEGSGKGFAEMEDEAETAGMVLGVFGKLAKLEGWEPLAPRKEKEKAKAKGKGSKKRKIPAAEVEEGGQQDTCVAESAVTGAGPSKRKLCAAAVAQERSCHGEVATVQDPSEAEEGGAGTTSDASSTTAPTAAGVVSAYYTRSKRSRVEY